MAQRRMEPRRAAHLVRAAASGDQRAWGELIDEFGDLVWAIARGHRLSHSDAADVWQTTWLRLCERIGDLRDPTHVGAWLATTARRECLRVLRGAARQVPTPDQAWEHEADPACTVDAVLTAERDRALWLAYARLGERDRALLRMLIAEPAPSYEEIGAALGMPVGSIGPTRARCLARLARELERAGMPAPLIAA